MNCCQPLCPRPPPFPSLARSMSGAAHLAEPSFYTQRRPKLSVQSKANVACPLSLLRTHSLRTPLLRVSVRTLPRQRRRIRPDARQLLSPPFSPPPPSSDGGVRVLALRPSSYARIAYYYYARTYALSPSPHLPFQPYFWAADGGRRRGTTIRSTASSCSLVGLPSHDLFHPRHLRNARVNITTDRLISLCPDWNN